MNGSSARMVPIFPTPVFSQQLDGHEAIDAVLRPAILTKQAADRGVTLSNVGGWQSRNDLQAWGGPAAARLAREAIEMASQATELVDPMTSADWRAEMWANVNDQGHSNQTHWHPGSYLSAVYYVDPGYDGASAPELGGELVFIDPRMPYLRMRTPDLSACSADGATSGQETWVRPTPGLLVMFPSFLSHSVRPYRGPGRRITIAINLVARVKP